MARIRTIQPDFPQSRSMARVNRDARLLFVYLWTTADDAGRLRADIRLLSGRLYPFDTDAPMMLPAWLDELEREGCIEQYALNGEAYVRIVNWRKYQTIDRPTPSRLPASPSAARGVGEGSRARDKTASKGLNAGDNPDSSWQAREENSDGIFEVQAPREVTKESALADLDRIQRDAERLKIFTPAIRALELKMRLGLPSNGQDSKKKGDLDDDGDDIPNVADVVG